MRSDSEREKKLRTGMNNSKERELSGYDDFDVYYCGCCELSLLTLTLMNSICRASDDSYALRFIDNENDRLR